MNHLQLALILAVGVAGLSQGQSLDDATSFDRLLQRSASTHRNVLLIFDSPSCAICKVLQKEFFADSALAGLLRREFIVRLVNSTVRGSATESIYENTPSGAIAKEFRVGGFPTLVVLQGKPKGGYVVVKTIRGVEFEPKGSGLLVFIKDGKAHFDLKDAYDRFSKLGQFHQPG